MDRMSLDPFSYGPPVADYRHLHAYQTNPHPSPYPHFHSQLPPPPPSHVHHLHDPQMPPLPPSFTQNPSQHPVFMSQMELDQGLEPAPKKRVQLEGSSGAKAPRASRKGRKPAVPNRPAAPKLGSRPEGPKRARRKVIPPQLISAGYQAPGAGGGEEGHMFQSLVDGEGADGQPMLMISGGGEEGAVGDGQYDLPNLGPLSNLGNLAVPGNLGCGCGCLHSMAQHGLASHPCTPHQWVTYM